jgi:hypothetical protein
MNKNGLGSKTQKASLSVTRAERALRRAAQNVRAQNRAFKLPVIIWQGGAVMEEPA